MTSICDRQVTTCGACPTISVSKIIWLSKPHLCSLFANAGFMACPQHRLASVGLMDTTHPCEIPWRICKDKMGLFGSSVLESGFRTIIASIKFHQTVIFGEYIPFVFISHFHTLPNEKQRCTVRRLFFMRTEVAPNRFIAQSQTFLWKVWPGPSLILTGFIRDQNVLKCSKLCCSMANYTSSPGLQWFGCKGCNSG